MSYIKMIKPQHLVKTKKAEYGSVCIVHHKYLKRWMYIFHVLSRKNQDAFYSGKSAEILSTLRSRYGKEYIKQFDDLTELRHNLFFLASRLLKHEFETCGIDIEKSLTFAVEGGIDTIGNSLVYFFTPNKE